MDIGNICMTVGTEIQVGDIKRTNALTGIMWGRPSTPTIF